MRKKFNLPATNGESVHTESLKDRLEAVSHLGHKGTDIGIYEDLGHKNKLLASLPPK